MHNTSISIIIEWCFFFIVRLVIRLPLPSHYHHYCHRSNSYFLIFISTLWSGRWQVIGGIQTRVVVVGRGYTYCGRVYHPVGGIRGGGAPFRDHIKLRIREWSLKKYSFHAKTLTVV
jgi:hypothetical protein